MDSDLVRTLLVGSDKFELGKLSDLIGPDGTVCFPVAIGRNAEF